MSDQPIIPNQAVARPLQLSDLGRGALRVLPGLALCEVDPDFGTGG